MLHTHKPLSTSFCYMAPAFGSKISVSNYRGGKPGRCCCVCGDVMYHQVERRGTQGESPTVLVVLIKWYTVSCIGAALQVFRPWVLEQILQRVTLRFFVGHSPKCVSTLSLPDTWDLTGLPTPYLHTESGQILAVEIRNEIMFDFYPWLPHFINGMLFTLFSLLSLQGLFCCCVVLWVYVILLILAAIIT